MLLRQEEGDAVWLETTLRWLLDLVEQSEPVERSHSTQLQVKNSTLRPPSYYGGPTVRI